MQEYVDPMRQAYSLGNETRAAELGEKMAKLSEQTVFKIETKTLVSLIAKGARPESVNLLVKKMVAEHMGLNDQVSQYLAAYNALTIPQTH